MKKIIALVLVLVMVLSLSTVAFAKVQSKSLLNDTLNIVDRVLGGKGYFGYDEYDSLLGKLIRNYDSVVRGIASAVRTMINNFFGVDDSPLARHVSNSITYVWSIAGGYDN